MEFQKGVLGIGPALSAFGTAADENFDRPICRKVTRADIQSLEVRRCYHRLLRHLL